MRSTLCILFFLAACSDPSTVEPMDDGGAASDDLSPESDLKPAGPICPSPPAADPTLAQRNACTFAAGAHADVTLGLTAQARAKIPITHVIVIVQENRSFDHLFGQLPGADGWPTGFTNPDKNQLAVAPYHLTTNTLPADPPHQGAAMKAGWNQGMMDGFVLSAAVSGSDGHYVMGYYDQTDLPFFHWLANTYAIADRYFGSALGGTWANRDYLYTGTSDGVLDTGARAIKVPSLFDALTAANVPFHVYTDGGPRQDCIGWKSPDLRVTRFPTFLKALDDGTLPPVSFVDPSGCQDEHPANDIHGGEYWMSRIYQSAIASPLWDHLAIIFTFDESGGLADHVPPPAACPPSASQSAFNRYGIRIPTMVISPWARRHHVSHVVHDHTSVLRLIEALWDLPALTARDANADALLDMFDFDCPPLAMPPPAADPGAAICL